MANNEQAVRDAAAALSVAITEATAAGYRIAWPTNVAGLDTIAISETARTIITADVVGSTEQIQFNGKRKASEPTKPVDDTKVF